MSSGSRCGRAQLLAYECAGFVRATLTDKMTDKMIKDSTAGDSYQALDLLLR